jgi:hypothetical protein
MPLIASGSRLIRHRAAAATGRWLTGGIPAANCIAAYEPMDAASLAASYTNLANPGTYNATLGVAPNWAAGTGWTGDGASIYLRTGMTPDATWSAIVRFSSATVGRIFAGETDKRFGIVPVGVADAYYLFGDVLTVAGGATASGVMAITPGKAWRNGVQVGTIPSAGTTWSEIYLLARQRAGAASVFYAGNAQRIYFYNIDISSYMAALTTGINS